MARYDYYNEYIQENPTVEDTEALLTLDLINYIADTGEYSRLHRPQGYDFEGMPANEVDELILNLQEIGNNPYIFMGGTGDESIGMYQKGKEGYRAEFREDKRNVPLEEKVDTLLINSPFTERLTRDDHPLDSYVAELAHAYQYGYGDEDYINYLNDRVVKEHLRLGDPGKYRNPFSIEYEAHSIVEPVFWDHVDGFLNQYSPYTYGYQGLTSPEEFKENLVLPSYEFYSQDVAGPENYAKYLNEQ